MNASHIIEIKHLFFSLLVKAPVHNDNVSSTTSNRITEFRILDPRVGQNFGSIILFISII
jgi:hypothetical protein